MFGIPATPLRSAPWQAAQACSYTVLPWAYVPLPAGRPLPSGATAMATAAISCAVAVAPKSNVPGYPWARARSGAARQSAARPSATSLATSSTARVRSARRVHILHTPVRRDAPALDRVHVIEQRAALERSTLRNELPVGRLRVAGLVGRPALDHRRLSVPDPREAEAGLADRQHRLLQ